MKALKTKNIFFTMCGNDYGNLISFFMFAETRPAFASPCSEGNVLVSTQPPGVVEEAKTNQDPTSQDGLPKKTHFKLP